MKVLTLSDGVPRAHGLHGHMHVESGVKSEDSIVSADALNSPYAGPDLATHDWSAWRDEFSVGGRDDIFVLSSRPIILYLQYASQPRARS